MLIHILDTNLAEAYFLDNSGSQGGGGRGPWRPEALKFFSWRPESKASLERTKMVFLAKWSPGVKQQNSRAPNFPSCSPAALPFLDRNRGALKPFGTLTTLFWSIIEPEIVLEISFYLLFNAELFEWN